MIMLRQFYLKKRTTDTDLHCDNLIKACNDIGQTKVSGTPQYQESRKRGEAKTHGSSSAQADTDCAGKGRRQGSKKEKALTFYVLGTTRAERVQVFLDW
jgi:hypothetical protein